MSNRQKFFRRVTYGTANLSGTQSSQVIFTAEENCTLRRIITQVSNRSSTSDSMAIFNIQIQPNGVQTLDSLSAVGWTNKEMPMEYLHGGIARSTAVLNKQDNKGMRKLRKGDEIVIVYNEMGNGSSEELYYYVDLFLSQ